MLSWLLSENIKIKNHFVKNRLKDIHQMIRELKQKSLSVKLLIYLELWKKIRQNLSLWSLGPEWLSKSPIASRKLQCSSSKNDFIVPSTSLNYTVINSESQPVILS